MTHLLVIIANDTILYFRELVCRADFWTTITRVVMRRRSGSPNKGKTMKYLVPPIVIPVLLLIGIVAYGMLRPPIIAGHPPTPAVNSQAR
jgi:hypothetical protein